MEQVGVDLSNRAAKITVFPAVSSPMVRESMNSEQGIVYASREFFASKQGISVCRSIAAGNTFELVANEWFNANQMRWVKTYSSRLRSRLDDDLLPALGKRPIADIEPLEILRFNPRIRKTRRH